jgi:hypothetical protein
MCVVAEVEVAEVDQAQDLAWLDFGFPMSGLMRGGDVIDLNAVQLGGLRMCACSSKNHMSCNPTLGRFPGLRGSNIRSESAVFFLLSSSVPELIPFIHSASFLVGNREMSDEHAQLDGLREGWKLCKAQDDQKHSLISVWQIIDAVADPPC